MTIAEGNRDGFRSGDCRRVQELRQFLRRASRSEFWYWLLFLVIVSIVASLLDFAIFPGKDWGPLNSVWTVVTLLPAISLNVRRLHDIDRTGWWGLLNFTIIGVLLLIYWPV